jgi:hypothetical protein
MSAVNGLFTIRAAADGGGSYSEGGVMSFRERICKLVSKWIISTKGVTFVKVANFSWCWFVLVVG